MNTPSSVNWGGTHCFGGCRLEQFPSRVNIHDNGSHLWHCISEHQHLESITVARYLHDLIKCEAISNAVFMDVWANTKPALGSKFKENSNVGIVDGSETATGLLLSMVSTRWPRLGALGYLIFRCLPHRRFMAVGLNRSGSRDRSYIQIGYRPGTIRKAGQL